MKNGIALFLALLAVAPLAGQPRHFVRGNGAGGYVYSYYLPQTASTPWRPAWSPDGKEIAFAMSGSIWKIGVHDDVAYELTASATYDSSPSWSPDGRWIAYTAEDADGIDLKLLNVATGESETIRTEGQSFDPTWSPDGKRLAFVRTAAKGEYEVRMLPFDNGKFGAPVDVTTENSFGRSRLYFKPYDDHIQPTWSPDSQEMILVSNRGIPLGSGAMWRVPVKAGGMAEAKMLLREETLYRTSPQWSHDGKRVLYASHRGSQHVNLYVLPVAGGEPYQLTFGRYDHFDPRWSPDGEWIAYIANEPGVSELRILRTFGGGERKVEIRRRVYRRPMGSLEVVVKNQGEPGAARLYVTGSDGKAYAPPTAYQRVEGRAAHRDFFHAEGRFTVDLPAGQALVDAAKGVEYLPFSQTVTIEPGKVSLLEVDLQRFTSMNAAGWYSGSDHVHMNYGGNLHNTPKNLMMMARGEDLDVVGQKVANKDNRIFDPDQYTGKPHPLSSPEALLFFDQEYRPPFYGHLNFINLTQHLLSPFLTGYEGTAIDSLYPSNTDMFRLGRAQGALGGYVHPFSRDPKSAGYAVARGFPVDLALETLDYMEVLTSAGHFRFTAPVWHRALNCGFRVTATAGEDSILSLHATPILGSSRLYAYLGEKLEWPAWVDAIRKGRTFVTNGPLVRTTVNGEIPGGEIHLPAGGGEVLLEGRVDSVTPLDKIEIFRNGKVVETLPWPQGERGVSFSRRIPVDESSWITVRASADRMIHPIDDSFVVGETGPTYILCGDQKIRSRTDAQYFVEWIDDITEQAKAHPGWRSEKEKTHVLDQFAEARRILVRRAEEAPAR
ncbi:MAG: hypothetical protein GC160_26225 [Acidobacteria bacterium]|nr:hypothetical protein [Acidobacteriota bacterium]